MAGLSETSPNSPTSDTSNGNDLVTGHTGVVMWSLCTRLQARDSLHFLSSTATVALKCRMLYLTTETMAPR